MNNKKIKPNKFKKILKYSLLLVIFVITLVFAGTKLYDKIHAATNCSLSFVPSSTSVAIGTTFALDVSLDVGMSHSAPHGVNGVSLYVTFDHTKMSLDSIDAGGSFPTPLAKTISNDAGTARLDVGTLAGRSAYRPRRR